MYAIFLLYEISQIILQFDSYPQHWNRFKYITVAVTIYVCVTCQRVITESDILRLWTIQFWFLHFLVRIHGVKNLDISHHSNWFCSPIFSTWTIILRLTFFLRHVTVDASVYHGLQSFYVIKHYCFSMLNDKADSIT